MHSGGTQEELRIQPGGTQETHRRHPGGTQETPRRHPGNIQGALRRHPGSTQEAPRRHPGGTQETRRRHPGSTQQAPRRHARGTEEAPRRHPGDTQETLRRHPGGTQQAPRGNPGGTQEAPRAPERIWVRSHKSHSLSNGRQTKSPKCKSHEGFVKVTSFLTAYSKQLMLAGSVPSSSQDSKPLYQDRENPISVNSIWATMASINICQILRGPVGPEGTPQSCTTQKWSRPPGQTSGKGFQKGPQWVLTCSPNPAQTGFVFRSGGSVPHLLVPRVPGEGYRTQMYPKIFPKWIPKSQK